MTRSENLDWFLFQIKPARFSHISREYVSSFVSFSQYLSSSTPLFSPATKPNSGPPFPTRPESKPNSDPASPQTSSTSFFASVDQPQRGTIVAVIALHGGSQMLREGLFGLTKKPTVPRPIRTCQLSWCHLQSGLGLNFLVQDQRSGLLGS